MLVFVEMLQTAGVEARRTTDNPVDFISLFEQKFGPETTL